MDFDWIYRGGERAFSEDRPLAEQILLRRGFADDAGMLAEFLSQRPGLSYDPFLMKDMEAAAERVACALEAGERICLYGDYDADGVCAVSLLLQILEKLGPRPDYYIPSRTEEGYGLHCAALDKIAARGVRLLITVDCGCSARREVDYAKSLGMDVLVTDHHNLQAGEALPDCLLLDPKRPDCAYPFKGLCGCGVAFKLAQALRLRTEARPLRAAAGKQDRVTKKDLAEVLDLAALATIGDIVPLLDENRSIAKYGLERIRAGKRPGLAALRSAAGLEDKALGAEDIAFLLVPQLNAAGRMAEAEICVRLLCGQSMEEVRPLAARLTEYNSLRRAEQEQAFRRIEAALQGRELPAFLLLKAEGVHEGVAGIVAGKLKDAYCRPAVLLTESEDGLLKGTGRSVEGIDLYALLSKQKALFRRFGGHASACGFSLRKEDLPVLRESLEQETEALRAREPALFRPKLLLDGELDPARADLKLLEDLEGLAPFGKDNEKPLFSVRGVRPEQFRFLGREQQHAGFSVRGLRCVLFQVTEAQRALLADGRPISLAGHLEENEWNGRRSLQLRLRDVKEYQA